MDIWKRNLAQPDEFLWLEHHGKHYRNIETARNNSLAEHVLFRSSCCSPGFSQSGFCSHDAIRKQLPYSPQSTDYQALCRKDLPSFLPYYFLLYENGAVTADSLISVLGLAAAAHTSTKATAHTLLKAQFAALLTTLTQCLQHRKRTASVEIVE